MNERSVSTLPTDLQTLTCRDVLEFLDLFIDDELPPQHAANFKIHTDKCPPCREYLKTYRETLRLTNICGELPHNPVDDKARAASPFPDGLVRAIMNSIKDSTPGQ